MEEIIRYGVISDTHGSVPANVFEVFEGVRRIYHCGDLGSLAAAAEFEAIAAAVAAGAYHPRIIPAVPA